MHYVKSVNVCGVYPYRIYRARPSEMEAPDDEGNTQLATRKILLRDDLDPKRLEETFHHELRHAYWEASGLGSFFAQLTGLAADRLDQAEETFIRLDTPACLSTFRAAGLLRGRR